MPAKFGVATFGEISDSHNVHNIIYRPLRYERVYLPLGKVADTPFHIQGDDMYGTIRKIHMAMVPSLE